MCDCIKQIEEKVAESFKKTIQSNEEYGYTEMYPLGIMFKKDGKTNTETVSHVKVAYILNTKLGKRQTKEKQYNMAHKFCPFCGEKYSE
jgi:hypothetical protein